MSEPPLIPPVRAAIARRWRSASSGWIPALVGLSLLLSLIALPDGYQPNDPHHVTSDDDASLDRAGSTLSRVDSKWTRSDRLVVRFRESSAGLADPQFRQALARYPGATSSPHFTQPASAIEASRVAGEARLGRPLPDLNRYQRIHLPRGMHQADANQLLLELTALDCVAVAFAEPLAEPASLEHDSDDGTPGAGESEDKTPDFRPLQLYRGEAPIGLGATAVASFVGARGRGVRLVDIEGGWNWAHEDLPEPFFQFGPTVEGWENHGTAVLGELIGSADDRGVEGIVPELQVGTISFSEIGVAAAIDLASSVLDVGDIILIELHAPGPNAPHGGGQFGFLPMEYWQDVFDAIQIATANGRIVVEAAGNGQQDLDAPIYRGLFDREVRDSGAVLVGAGTPLGLTAERFTNYGSRLDLHGWGTSITTAGYGTLHDEGRNRWYTTGFGGTSGASPMVCGAIASLQGMSLATYGVSLDRDLAVELLASTGSRATGDKIIGPRPNLVAARERLLQGVGTIHGVAREGATAKPIPHLRIVLDGERTIWTDSRGSYHASVLTGLHSLAAAGFWYEESVAAFEIGPRDRLLQHLRLSPRPIRKLNAIVTRNAETVPDAPIALRATPLAGRTDSCGELVFEAPTGTYVASAGPMPGTGAAWQSVDLAQNSDRIVLALPNAETFEESPGGYTSDSGWTLGASTSSGPIAHSGTRLWATSSNGDYRDDSRAVLTSPPLALGAASMVHLSFSHWYRIESAWDGGRVEVWDGSDWHTAVPLGGYPMEALSALEWGPGFSGASNGWEAVLFDLSARANDDFRIRFVFGSDESITDLGWYLDDIAIVSDLDPGSAPEPGEDCGLDVTSNPGLRFEPAFPNPFAISTRLRYSLSALSRVELAVHDANGRRVRQLTHATLEAGPHELTWNGADDAGRLVPAGVYYGRLSVNGTTLVRSLLRIH